LIVARALEISFQSRSVLPLAGYGTSGAITGNVTNRWVTLTLSKLARPEAKTTEHFVLVFALPSASLCNFAAAHFPSTHGIQYRGDGDATFISHHQISNQGVYIRAYNTPSDPPTRRSWPYIWASSLPHLEPTSLVNDSAS
jgi:hypothetical protein